MQRFDKVFNIVFKSLLAILMISIIIGAIRYISNPSRATTSAPPPLIITPSGDSQVATSATQMSEAQVPIPTEELVYLENRDYSGLQKYLDDQAQNWVNMSMNIHSLEVFGVGKSSEKVQSEACTWPIVDQLLCRTAEIEYTAVYKGILTGGVQAEFVLHPVVTLKEDWTEVGRTSTGNKTVVEYSSTAIVTYSGNMCITSVEENTPSSVQEDELPPTDKSYIIKSKDERRLWPDLGPYIFPTGINEDFLRIDAYKIAKDTALIPSKVILTYDLIEGDLLPGGKFYEAIKAFYTPELAKQFKVKGFELVFLPTRGDPLLRCDGTNVNK